MLSLLPNFCALAQVPGQDWAKTYGLGSTATISPLHNDTSMLVGDRTYECTNHLDNVIAVVSDRKVPETDLSDALTGFESELLTSQDYYPFGAAMQGRGLELQSYRFGFGGKERDDAIKGNRNSYNFVGRFYDPRVGRWLNSDPLEPKFPEQSTYQYAFNNPVYFQDASGAEPNKGQAADWTEIQTIIEQHFARRASNQSIHKLRYTAHAQGGGGQVGPFGGSKGKRYVYTLEAGWVDFGHFFQVASQLEKQYRDNLPANPNVNGTELDLQYAAKWVGRKVPLVDWWSLQLAVAYKTYEVEEGQRSGGANANDTYWSYEDGPSNLLGAEFWLYWYRGDETLVEDLTAFFDSKGVVDPALAPNWNDMPQSPQRQRTFWRNLSIWPVPMHLKSPAANGTPASQEKDSKDYAADGAKAAQQGKVEAEKAFQEAKQALEDAKRAIEDAASEYR